MSVSIRLKRMGRKNHATYRIVAIEGRQRRDGRILEKLGWYDPHIADDKRFLCRRCEWGKEKRSNYGNQTQSSEVLCSDDVLLVSHLNCCGCAPVSQVVSRYHYRTQSSLESATPECRLVARLSANASKEDFLSATQSSDTRSARHPESAPAANSARRD